MACLLPGAKGGLVVQIDVHAMRVCEPPTYAASVFAFFFKILLLLGLEPIQLLHKWETMLS